MNDILKKELFDIQYLLLVNHIIQSMISTLASFFTSSLKDVGEEDKHYIGVT